MKVRFIFHRLCFLLFYMTHITRNSFTQVNLQSQHSPVRSYHYLVTRGNTYLRVTKFTTHPVVRSSIKPEEEPPKEPISVLLIHRWGFRSYQDYWGGGGRAHSFHLKTALLCLIDTELHRHIRFWGSSSINESGWG